jgi:hypothetical protein
MTITLAKGFTGSCLLSRASWGVLATRGSPLVERLGRLVRGKYSPGRVGRTPPVARVYLVSPNCFSFPGARCWGRVIGCPGENRGVSVSVIQQSSRAPGDLARRILSGRCAWESPGVERTTQAFRFVKSWGATDIRAESALKTATNCVPAHCLIQNRTFLPVDSVVGRLPRKVRIVQRPRGISRETGR